jgi:hypothetical protein
MNSKIYFFEKNLLTSRCIIFEKLENPNNSFIIISDIGVATIFNIKNKQILFRKKISNLPVKKAIIFDDFLIITDITFKVIIYKLPDLLIYNSISLVSNEYNNSINLKDNKNFEMGITYKGELLFIFCDFIIIAKNDFDELLKVKLPAELKGGYLFSPDRAKTIKLISKKLEEYSIIIKDEKIEFNYIRKYGNDNQYIKPIYRKKSKEKGEKALFAFHNQISNAILIINDDNHEIISIGLNYRLRLSEIFINAETNLLLIGTDAGILYYTNIKKDKKLNSIKICNEKIIYITYIDDRYIIMDKTGGLYILDEKLSNMGKTFNSMETKKIFISPDYDYFGVILIRTIDGRVVVLDYEKSLILFSPNNPLFYRSYGEGIVDHSNKKVVLFSGNGTIFNFYYNGEKKKIDIIGPQKPYVIKKYEGKYYLGTAAGNCVVYDESFKLIYKNKISKESILIMNLFKVRGELYITFTTANGTYILYRFLSNSRIIEIKKEPEVILGNSIIVENNDNYYFIYAAEKHIVAINIHDKTEKFKIKRPSEIQIHHFFILSSFSKDEFCMLTTNGNIYKAKYSYFEDNNNSLWDEENIIYKFDKDIDETSFITINDDIIVADLNSNITILRYKGYKEGKYNLPFEILSVFEYFKGMFIASSIEGKLYFFDILNKKYKTDKIKDWILDFHQLENNSFIGSSYKGKLFKFYIDNDSNIIYDTFNISIGKIFASTYDYISKNLFLINSDFKLFRVDIFSLSEKSVLKNKIKLLSDKIIKTNNIFIMQNYVVMLNNKYLNSFNLKWHIYDIKGENLIDIESSIKDIRTKFKLPKNSNTNKVYLSVFDVYQNILFVLIKDWFGEDYIIICDFLTDNDNIEIKCKYIIKANKGITGILTNGSYIMYATEDGYINKCDLSGNNLKTYKDKHKINLLKKFGNNIGIITKESLNLKKINPFEKKNIMWENNKIHYSDNFEYDYFDYFYNSINIKGGDK